MVNAGRILIMPKGEWDTLVSYNMLDLVTYSGVAYLAKQASTGVNPKTDPNKDAYWQVFGTSVVPDNDTIIFDGNNNLAVNIDGTTIQYDSGTNFVKVAIDGVSLKYDSTNGYIYANVSSSLAGLTDVQLTNIQNGQIIAYNSATGKFVNINLPTGGGSKIKVTTSETTLYGKTVTLSDGTHTLTGTFSNAGEYTFEGVEYTGNLTITSSDGTDTATRYLTVPYYSSYSVSLTFFEATVTVTYPENLGATCELSDGTTTITATGSPMAFIVPNVGTWIATVTLDGADKTGSVTIGASGESKSITITYGTINLTYGDDFRGETITCVQGGTTISKTAPSAGNTMTFYPNNTGNWVISGTVGGDIYYSTPNPVVVSSLSTPVSAGIETVPNGSTVTPVNDVEIWLTCAQISDVSYTTLAEVLADAETYERLLSDSNACDYMARSTTWALATGQVPAMTSATTPSGTVTQSDYNTTYGIPYKAFDDDWDKNANPVNLNTWYCNDNENEWLAYEFTSAKPVRSIKLRAGIQVSGSGYIGVKDFKIQYSDDGSTWTDEGHTFTYQGTNGVTPTAQMFSLDDVGSHTHWRIYVINNYSPTASFGLCVGNLQFYEEADITTSQDAMMRLGKYDYAYSTLLGVQAWAEAIASSSYSEYVLAYENGLVPKMTGNTSPSGEASASTWYSQYNIYPYMAFDGTVTNGDDCWQANTSGGQSWLQYEFPTARKVTFITIQDRNNSAAVVPVVSAKLQGSNDGQTFTDLATITRTGYGSPCYKTGHYINNSTAYKIYRLADIVCTHGGTSPYFATIGNLQFFGEATKTDIVVSAPESYVYYMQDGSPVNLCYTDSDGIGTIDWSDLPKGEITLYSSVAKDPDNLSNDYSKTVKINENTTEIYLMPEGALYWYGYETSDIEDMNTANGWQAGASGYSFNTPTRQTNYIDTTAGASKICNVVSKNLLSGDLCAITEGVTISGTDYMYLNAYHTKNWNSGFDAQVPTTTSEITLSKLLNQTDRYFGVGTGGPRAGKIYAIYREAS